MKDSEYYKSGKHVANVILARCKATEQAQVNKQKRINDYNIEPCYCAQCKTPLVYASRKNKFCCKSCSATYNNTRRMPRTAESRAITSKSLIGKPKAPRTYSPKTMSGQFCKILWNTCPVCDALYYTKGWKTSKKSCGKSECITHLKVGNRPYKNGRRKIFYYFNKHQNITVLLESSWELDMAQWLDSKDIKWMRPTYIKWYDEIKIKERLYYPYFYLPAINLYLDPKNPTAMTLEKYKMSCVEKLIPIIYGNLDYIKQSIMSEILDSN